MKLRKKLTAVILIMLLALSVIAPDITMAETGTDKNISDTSDTDEYSENTTADAADMSDMASAELADGEGELSVPQGSAIYLVMTDDSHEPPVGSELVWILEYYDGAEWVPASGVGYHTYDDLGVTCEKDLYTDSDGMIILTKTENGYPYIRFIEAEVFINPGDDPVFGEYRITEDLKDSSSSWGALIGYWSEEDNRPVSMDEHDGIAFVNGTGISDEVAPEEDTEEEGIALFSVDAVYEDDVLYMSDIDPVYQYIGWGSMRRDLNPSDTTITLRVNGSATSFEKGIGAHAESTLIYDVKSIYEQGYDSFLTYYGVDYSKSSGNVKFFMYTTTDEDYQNAVWTEVEGVDNSAKSGSSEAGFIEIPLTEDMTYLKLYADPNGGNGSDHSVYADAKFIKSNIYFDSFISPTSVYDVQLKEYYEQYGDNISANADYENLLLKRELVDRVGYYEFQDLLAGTDGEGIKEMISWIFDHPTFFKMYLTGGSVGPNYLTGGYSYSASSNDPYTASLRVMYELWQKYPSEFADTSNNSLYPKMIISISLTLTGNVKYWMGTTGSSSTDPTDNSIIYPDPVERYEIYKYLYSQGLLVDYFCDLQVPEMRYVMASSIHNDELIWASNLAKERNYNTNCYSWMHYAYNGYSYHRDLYYNDETWGSDPTYDYVNKYNLSEYGITNYGYGVTTMVKYPMLWMGLVDGGTCWPIANLCQNIWSSYGRPCYICGSMGGTHEVYMAYNRQTAADGTTYGRWTIENGCGGDWNSTHYGAYDSTGWHIARMINDWGMGSDFEFNNSSYIILGQSAINDFDNFVKAEELEMLSKVFEGDDTILEQIYWDMLDIEGFHFDAWYGLVKLYAASSVKTDEDRYELVKKMTSKDALFYYPLPMHDLVKVLLRSVNSSVYSSMISNEEKTALREAVSTTDADFYSAYAVRVVSNWLLGNAEEDVASFSFDGENAGKIILSDRFTDPEYWEYSLDGGQTWSAIIHDTAVDDADAYGISTLSQIVVSNPNVVQLTDEEIAQINPDDNILIRFIQVPDYWHTINIEKSATPVVGSTDNVTGLYANPWENSVIYADDTMEWRNIGDTEWTKFTDASPDKDANTNIEVRYAAHSTYTAGDPVQLSFENSSNYYKEREGYSYIPLSRITICDSTSEANTTRAVKYAADGSIYSFYQTPTNTAFPHYLTLKLNRPAYLSSLEYQCNLGNTANGQIQRAKVYVSMTGNDDDWAEVEYLDGTDGLADYDEDKGLLWNTGNNQTGKAPKTVCFTPVQAQYIKIVSYAGGNGANMTSIAAIRLYESAGTANKDELEKLTQDFLSTIEDGTLNQVGYMSSSWNVFDKALQAAENILNDPDASQEEIDNAYAAILTAYDGLEECYSISGTITWDDDSNRDGIRPSILDIDILADGVTEDTVEIYASGENTWTYTITDLPKDDDILYTTRIHSADGYTITENGDNNFTLSHTPETVYITVKITWDDNDDEAGARPQTIRCHLLADGVKADSANLTYSNCQWNYTGFASRPKYSNGKEINYTVVLDSETNPATNYISTYNCSGTDFEIINTYAPGKTTVSVIKTWDDDDNRDGLRPDFVTVELLKNNVPTGETLLLTAENNWRGSFTGLDISENGTAVSYSVAESETEGYDTSIEYSASFGTVITNSHTPETISISGTKSWDDDDDSRGLRPENAVLHLYADGIRVANITVNAQSGWAWTVRDLPRYSKGREIVYTVAETPTDSYTADINGYDITNTYSQNMISVPVSVTWNDPHNTAEYIPEEIIVTLVKDGNVTDITLTLNAENGWTGEFSELQEYTESGRKIIYSAEINDLPPEFTSVITEDPDGSITVTVTPASASGQAQASENGSDNSSEESGRTKESVNLKDTEDATDYDIPSDSSGHTASAEVKWADPSGSISDVTVSLSQNSGTVRITEAGAEDSSQSSSSSDSDSSALSGNDSVFSEIGSSLSGNVTVTLTDENNDPIETAVLSEENGWKYSFENVYDNDIYTLTAQTDDYYCELTGTAESGFAISITPAQDTVQTTSHIVMTAIIVSACAAVIIGAIIMIAEDRKRKTKKAS